MPFIIGKGKDALVFSYTGMHPTPKENGESTFWEQKGNLIKYEGKSIHYREGTGSLALIRRPAGRDGYFYFVHFTVSGSEDSRQLLLFKSQEKKSWLNFIKSRMS